MLSTGDENWTIGIEPEKIRIDSNLYHKMNSRYLSGLLSLVSEDIETITLFGHNPSFSVIPESLCKEGFDFLPKCGIICVSFNIRRWAEFSFKTGKMEYFLKPEK